MSGKEKKNSFNSLINKFNDALGIPSEIILNLPLVTIVGCNEINIENFKNIIEFGEERVRVGTSSGELCLNGKGMILKKATAENIVISGKISTLEYMP